MQTPSLSHHRGSSASRWRYWQWFLVRSAGFPIEGLGRLCVDAASAAADELASRTHEAALARQQALKALQQYAYEEVDEAERRALKIRARRARTKLRASKRLREEDLAALGGRIPQLGQWVVAEESREAAFDSFMSAWGEELPRVRQTLRELVSDDAVREAVHWQSPTASTRVEALIGDGLPVERNHSVRTGERLAMMYLQRFLAKNDTIGYFGAASVGEFVDGPSSFEPGASLLRKREVFLEHWAMVQIAQAVARDPQAKPHLRPRKMPTVYVEGHTLRHADGRTEELPPAWVRLVGLCDGTRAIHKLEKLLCKAESVFDSPADLESALSSIEERGAITRVPIVPVLDTRPNLTLRTELANILPPDAHAPWEARLERLEQLRTALEESRGVAEVKAALTELERFFEEVTGWSARRGGGKTYEARSIAYLECARDVGMNVSEDVLPRLEPLELVYDTIRAYTARLWEDLLPEFDALQTELADATGRADFPRFLATASERFLNQARGEVLLVDFQRAWLDSLNVDADYAPVELTVTEMRKRLGPLLEASEPGWPNACFQSPDLMFAASSAEAMASGDFLPVLGEIHPCANTVLFPCILKLSPDVLAVATQAYAQDLPQVVRPAPPGEEFQRARHHVPPNCPSLTVLDTSWPPPDPAVARTLAIGDLVVTRDAEGTLVVATRDGRLTLDFRVVLDNYLVNAAPESFQLLDSERLPRVTVDGVVISRERWRLPCPTKAAGGDAASFLSVRRWAQTHGLPRRVFVKSPSERKPIMIDFDNPFLVEALLYITSKVEYVDVSEMLPGPHETWLPDASGRSYTCELRVCAVDATARRGDDVEAETSTPRSASRHG
ncbi:MAG: lantibiotic dehydratase [Myxococcota bacterium]